MSPRAGYKSSLQEEHLAYLSSSDTPVVVMESTEYGGCVDASLCRERPWNRLLVPETLVRTRFIVEAHVLGDDAPEVILTEDEDMVEQLSAERADEAFKEGIHVRRAYRRAYDAHPRRPEYAGEARSELRVMVADDKVWRAVHRGVPGLCAHHSSVGAYVTAAWRILRRRRSRKKSTNNSRNRMSNACTKSHAHVTWFRRNVDQLCPSPRGRERRMYR